jgi:hypothetical protein
MQDEARAAAGRSWAAILRLRSPEFRWTVIDPRRERNSIAATGQIVGRLAAPEDQRPLLDRNAAAGAA